jgi:hypothetical protein
MDPQLILLASMIRMNRGHNGDSRILIYVCEPANEHRSPSPLLWCLIIGTAIMALLSDVVTYKAWLTVYAPVLCVVYYLLWTIYARTFHPLANIPGPFWASISRTWLMWHRHNGDIEVVKEAIRIWPAFSVSQPRYAPSQGIELCGKYIPAGYSVGLNPAIVQHDRGVFGADALDFQPERWLESEERTRAMDKAILTWGAGTRTCVGRPVSSCKPLVGDRF